MGSASGALVLVVGQNAVGRTALITAARRRLSTDPRVVFPRRIITLSRSLGPEIHQAVTPAQFLALQGDGALTLCWDANGVSYGLPSSLDEDLAAGRVVVAKVSQSVVAEAWRRYPHVLVVEVTARPEVLAKRRWLRAAPAEGRATEHRAAASYSRNALRIDNSGPLDEALAPFLDIVMTEAERASRRRRGVPVLDA